MHTETSPPRKDGSIEHLHANGPSPNIREKLMLFGQFVGDWDILESRYLRGDGQWVQQRGELHWGWILDGKAVQDVWLHFDETGRLIPDGTTVRFYDHRIDAWHSIWVSPNHHGVMSFVGRQVNDEIVLEGRGLDGNLLKWIFYEISPNSFNWRGEESNDQGKSWVVTEEMQIRRRDSRD